MLPLRESWYLLVLVCVMKMSEDMVIGPKHRALLGVNYCPSRKYQHPLHSRCTGKVSRGLNLKMLKEFKETWDTLRFSSLNVNTVLTHALVSVGDFAPCDWIKTVLNSGFHTVDSGFLVLYSHLCQRDLASGFQSLAGFWFPWAVFRIPMPKILGSTCKNSRIPESGFPYMRRMID